MKLRGKFIAAGVAVAAGTLLTTLGGLVLPSIADSQNTYRCADITFGTGNSDRGNTPDFGSVTVTNIELPSFSSDKVYQSDGGSLRFSSKGGDGSLTITFADELHITAVRLIASVYNSDSGVQATVSFGGPEETYTVDISNSNEPSMDAYSGEGHYAYTLASSEPVSLMTISGKKSKRFYLYKIVFTLNEESRIPSGGQSTSSTVSSSSSSSESSSSSSDTGGDIGDLPSYYDGIDWSLTGAALKSELSDLIYSHTNVGYDGLLDAYPSTDCDEDGYIVDMYSNEKYLPSDAGGNYKGEGDCYNREHIVPQSVFYENAPMVSDLFHVYPTDGYVNNRRNNYPHGEVGDSVVYTSNNGSKLGTSSYPGYSGTVFEPIDKWKGDIARSYFYMVTCYEDKLSSWKAYDSFDGKSYPGLSSWAKELYLEWNELDPVDDWERQRNEAVFQIQHNRNPFIDNPDAANLIWA